jgi:homoserine dehydrogenase
VSKNKLKIAIAGVGTVGKGLLNLLDKYKSNNVEVSAIASRKKIKLKSKIFKNTIFFKDAKDLLSFDDFDVLVELIGGDSGISKEIVFEALKKKKECCNS